MTIIYGDSFSGKTSMAMNLIKEKSVYLSLDGDKTIAVDANTELVYIDDIYIDFRSLCKDGVKQIVIDPINKLCQIDPKKDLLYVIERLKNIESDYNIEIITVYNTLSNFKKIKREISKISNVFVLEMNRKNKSQAFIKVD